MNWYRGENMGHDYEIHPSVGIARVGNSPEFYLAPRNIGALPTEIDAEGSATGIPVQHFKDRAGRMRRQAAQFRIYRYRDGERGTQPEEITLDSPEVVEIQWTVHPANKKACWYEFLPLIGDDMLGPENSYDKQKNNPKLDLHLRNADTVGSEKRRRLMIDPGPRRLNGRNGQIDFNEKTAGSYPFVSFPAKPTQGHWIRTLGELRTDDAGRLLALPGFGFAGGNKTISGFAGADTWHDDIADGPVTCRITLRDSPPVCLEAWLIVGAPKVAPELVNMVTLDDVMFDVAVRFQNAIPDLCYRDPNTKDPYEPGVFDTAFNASYERDIEPIFRRPLDYVWVANVPSMIQFAAPAFDPKDPSDRNRQKRMEYWRYFRRPGWNAEGQHNDLFLKDNAGRPVAPLMPLNSGSNSVRTNDYIDKFLTLTETQYFLLAQWAAGRFTVGSSSEVLGLHDIDRTSVGNCVGGPLCPGIEVTWNLKNPKLYKRPYRIKHAREEDYYEQHGLDPGYDETSGEGLGCEPGDLTKRMAIPWQADFFNCTAQFINYTDPKVNKDDNLIPVPPTYYSYWWPPQSPMYVIANQLHTEDQRAAGVMAGYPVYYQRGLNTYAEVIEGWSYLAFIVNQNTEPEGRAYGYFVEQERNETAFSVTDVAIGGPGNLINAEDQNFTPSWFLRPYSVREQALHRSDREADVGEPVRSAIRTDRR
jgi:L-lysine 6-oxidase